MQHKKGWFHYLDKKLYRAIKIIVHFGGNVKSSNDLDYDNRFPKILY